MEAASFMTGERGHHGALPWVRDHPDYFPWAFVRNPYTRFISAYVRCYRAFQRNDGPWAGDTMSECLHMLEHGGLPIPYFYPQVTFIGDGKGNLLVEFIGRFERLHDDWRQLCDRLGMPVEPLQHKARFDYLCWDELCTDKMVDTVNHVYVDDFEAFDYPMVTSRHDITRN